ncbi:MAG: Fic family protein [Rhodobacteraceae bacterium]|nr:Fic family protein [Paracoccaceae bacterium]
MGQFSVTISAVTGSAKVAAPLLAHVFAATIRIHPFEDGNGRVARFTVQFLLTRWGMDLLPLPKVRNDPEWKRALRSAVRGELGELIDQIRNRLEQRHAA